MKKSARHTTTTSVGSGFGPGRKLLHGNEIHQNGPAIPEAAPYLADLQRLNEPLLTREDELALAIKRHNGTPAEQAHAQNHLAQANLRLVVALARKLRQQYPQKHVDMNDLLQEGNTALMHAIQKFDPARNVRFATYATWWIYQAMYTYLHQYGRPCRIPGNTLTQINHVRRAKQTLATQLNRPPNDEEIASYLKLPVAKIQELQRISLKPISLDASIEGDEGSTYTPTTLPAPGLLPEEATSQRLLYQRLRHAWHAHLSEKEQQILQAHFGLSLAWCSTRGATTPTEAIPLHVIGQQFGVSREAIRKAEKRALQKLRALLN